jgi:hypothetical protein
MTPKHLCPLDNKLEPDISRDKRVNQPNRRAGKSYVISTYTFLCAFESRLGRRIPSNAAENSKVVSLRGVIIFLL